MKFVFANGEGKWDPSTHTYENTTDDGTPKWWVDNDPETSGDNNPSEWYLDGVNNIVTVTNHSNSAINADFTYTMIGQTKFDELYNDAIQTAYLSGTESAFNILENSNDAVVGGFYEGNDDAVSASGILEDTYAGGSANSVAFSSITSKTRLELATAEGRDPDDGWVPDRTEGTAAAPGTWVNDKISPGEASDHSNIGSVYFAFSGTPDHDDFNVLPGFRKVGIITVTITPNDDTDLNEEGDWVPTP